MRVGDSYKIRDHIKFGTPDDEIVKMYKWSYSEEEIREFIEKARKADQPGSKKKSGKKPDAE